MISRVPPPRHGRPSDQGLRAALRRGLRRFRRRHPAAMPPRPACAVAVKIHAGAWRCRPQPEPPRRRRRHAVAVQEEGRLNRPYAVRSHRAVQQPSRDPRATPQAPDGPGRARPHGHPVGRPALGVGRLRLLRCRRPRAPEGPHAARSRAGAATRCPTWCRPAARATRASATSRSPPGCAARSWTSARSWSGRSRSLRGLAEDATRLAARAADPVGRTPRRWSPAGSAVSGVRSPPAPGRGRRSPRGRRRGCAPGPG